MDHRTTHRTFTPDTARRTLGRLRPTAERMCTLVRCLEQRKPRRLVAEQRVDPLYFRLVTRLHEALGVIHASGARVHDLREGLLGFPARRAGRDVLLFWKVGEGTVRFWREEAAAASEAKPVDEDGPWEDA